MKVCFIASQIFAWGKYGGFGSVTRTIGKELVKRGINVCAVVPRRGDQEPIEELDGMTVYGYRPSRFLFAHKPYKLCDADIYHSEEPSFGTYLAMKTMPGRKHIITCQDPRNKHDWDVFYKYWTKSKRLTFPLSYIYENNYLTNQCVKRANAVYCQAKFIIPKAKDVYKLAHEPGFLPNPVVIPTRGLKKAQSPTVCFVGRLDTIKRPDIFCELSKEFPKVKFILLGKSEDKIYDKSLREKYGSVSNLEMAGFIDQFHSRDRFNQILEQSWVVVNTSIRECLPVSYLEAAAYKCAILSGTEKDPDDFAKNFGCYVQNDNYASGLEFLLESNRWQEQGEKGYEYVRKTHELNAVIDKHIAVYQGFVTRKTNL